MKRVSELSTKELLTDKKNIIFPEVYKGIYSMLKSKNEYEDICSGFSVGANYKMSSLMLHNLYHQITISGKNPSNDGLYPIEILKRATDSIFLFFTYWTDGMKHDTYKEVDQAYMDITKSPSGNPAPQDS